MKAKRAIVASAIILGAAIWAHAAEPAAAVPRIDPSVPFLRVNGQTVTYLRYRQAASALMGDLKGTGRHGQVSPNDPKIQEQILYEVVKRTVLLQKAAEDPPENLDRQLEESFGIFRSSFPSDEAWAAMLSEERMGEQDVRDLLKEDLLLAHYVETKIIPDVEVTEQHLQNYYNANKKSMFAHSEQVNLRHILIRSYLDPAANLKAQEKIKEIRRRIEGGEDFARVALDESEDVVTRQFGGLLGFRSREDLPPQAADACFSAADGGLTPVVQTPYGYHVFQVTGRRGAEDFPFEEVKEKIREVLVNSGVRTLLDMQGKKFAEDAVVEALISHGGRGETSE